MALSRFKKGCLASVIVVVMTLGGGVWYLTWMMSQPLYKLGSVRSETNLRGPLNPPDQEGTTSWKVESDINLSFEAHGSGKPVLIIHGGPGIPYADLWKGLDSLTSDFKFYFYHQRGCGTSSRPIDKFDDQNYYSNMIELERTLGLGAHIADIERIRRILGQDKITIVGHSFGGFIATLYAAEFPERVDKLILVAPAGVLTPPDKERNLFDLARAKLDEKDRVEFDKVMDEYFDFGGIFSKSDTELADVHHRTGAFLLKAMGYGPSEIATGPPCGGWSVFAIYFSCGTAQDFRPALALIKAPTLIVHGEDDTMCLAGARTYESIDGSKFTVIKREDAGRRAGHFVYDDCPAEFASVVGRFLKGKDEE